MARTPTSPAPTAHWLPGLYTYAEFFVCVAVFLPILAVVALLHRSDPGCRVRGRWLSRLGRLTVLLTPLWRFRVEGEAPRDILTRPYVVVANHESTADVFLLAGLPWDMRWVAKAEIFRFPVVGWLMRLAGHIPLARGGAGSMRAMRARCLETLQSGVPVMIFPEGTRSPDGSLLPFRDGAFEMAIEAGVPILPVAVAGSRHCRVPGSIWFGKAEARARILAPLSTEGMGPDDVAVLREAARDAIDGAVHALREELGLDAEGERLSQTGAPFHTL